MPKGEKLAQYLYNHFTEPQIHIPWNDMPEKIQDGYKVMALQLLDEIGYKDMYEALKHLMDRIDEGLALGEKLDLLPARQAIAKAEGK